MINGYTWGELAVVGLGIDAVRRVPGAVVRHVAALEVVGLDRLLQAVLVDAPVGVILINKYFVNDYSINVINKNVQLMYP